MCVCVCVCVCVCDRKSAKMLQNCESKTIEPNFRWFLSKSVFNFDCFIDHMLPRLVGARTIFASASQKRSAFDVKVSR